MVSDGRQISYTKYWDVQIDGYPTERSTVMVAAADGSHARRLVKGSGSRGPSRRADGNTIAFTYRDSLATITPEGTNLRIVRRLPSIAATVLSNRKRLLFTKYIEEPSPCPPCSRYVPSTGS